VRGRIGDLIGSAWSSGNAIAGVLGLFDCPKISVDPSKRSLADDQQSFCPDLGLKCQSAQTMEAGVDHDRSAAAYELVRHFANRWLIAVIDCCYAQEEKDEEQTHRVEDRNCKTSQEVLGHQTGATSDQDGQEKTIEEKDILENESAR